MARAFVDLHCHTSASFDSIADPTSVVRAAASRGLTHLAITDHDTIDGALRARDAAPPELRVLVGQEIRTLDGDLIGLFLERTVPRDLPTSEAIARIRDQGGLVGIPHPFDRFRGSILRDRSGEPNPMLDAIAPLVHWIEAHNARVLGGRANERAAAFAAQAGLPGISVSDAHSALEVGVAYSVLEGDPSTPEGLKAALAPLVPTDLVTGRATYFARGITPVAKLLHRIRGGSRPGAAT